VGIAGDQRDPGQAPGGEVAEEPQPAGPVLRGGDLYAQDRAVPVGVDSRGHQGMDVGQPASRTLRTSAAAATNVYGPCPGAGAERLDLFVEVGGHDRDLGLGEPDDAQGFDERIPLK